MKWDDLLTELKEFADKNNLDVDDIKEVFGLGVEFLDNTNKAIMVLNRFGENNKND